uniref:MIF4G_like_2 domain-containing protein n=1 Tax=Parastrongyloides trichosuri TaxID=131310 RepID=A0A0N4ZW37_PARTI
MAQLGYNGMEAIINKITTVLSDNLVPFMVQIQNNMNSMINLSDDMETIFGEAYKLVLSFATNQEITNVFCAIKNSLTSNEWSVLYPGMNNFALMNLYVDSC